MRTLMTIFLAMICISVGFMADAQAQSIIISVDGKNPETDTLNFGARTENNPKVDSFFVFNNTNDTLLIPFDPFYLNRVNAIPFDNSFAEFELDTIQQRNRPFIILPQSTLPIKINFKVDTADKGAGFEADLSKKKGRIFINLCKLGDTTTILASDTIHLFGDRTARFMKPSDSVMVFDTMYLGTTKTDTLIVYNGTSTKTLNVNITKIDKANVNINQTDIGIKSIPPDGALRIPIEYTVNSLADSLIRDVLSITSSPGANTQDETSSINLKTFVAFQKLEINKINTTNLLTIGEITFPSDSSLIYTDTIDVGKSRLFEIAVQNTGNIPITIDSITAEGQFKDNFIVEKNPSIRNVQPDGSTKISVLFSPKLNGPIQTNIVVHTNLKSIFQKITNNDDKQYITVTGIGRSGELYIDNGDETCKSDTILFSDKCITPCSNTFTLENKTVTPVTIKKIEFTGDPSAFRFEPPINSVIDLNSGETKYFKVIYSPGKREGYFKGSLTFITEGKIENRDFDYVSISPEASIIADTIFASPGDILSIPIIAKTKNASIQLADYFRLRFRIPNQSLKGIEYYKFMLNPNIQPVAGYEITDTLETGTQSIYINAIDTNGPFILPSDTLGTLHLKYFLNEHMSSEIIISEFFIGSLTGGLPCDSMYTITRLPKIIIKAKENSFCADQETLDSFFRDIRSKTIAFTAMMPLSGESVVEIQHLIPEQVHADISLYSVTGEKVETIFSGIAQKELTKIRHPLTHVSKGVYYCELKTGTYRKTIPIIVSQ